ncbi:class I SAM-dependent methyltransferase [Rhodococcus sp. T2V]|uniref:HemK2/MTQ2 family protein methyltransferase n=1 Tax=Rhodococcus sp. T2V TaxID=3034164 RepID=UPI0023E1C6CC|nr:HemK2/MTQ2 family protein methyltransferase [Rhodococcus sp. T2V]MDF3312869.1 class I SAM-dependent methyltransferase [Rhodococcus sp. T2V]
MLLRLPGVYPPQADTGMLAALLASEHLDAESRVLDLCTGTGVLGVRAAALGAGCVTAVDISRRALINTRLNAALGRRSLRIRRGDLTAPVRGERFALVMCNPPYVPAHDDALPVRGAARAWDAGRNGRALLDRVCVEAPEVLDRGGVLLIAQSALSGVTKTRIMLEERGMRVEIAARVEVPFGPVLSSRSSMFEKRGLIASGQRSEELVVVRAVR